MQLSVTEVAQLLVDVSTALSFGSTHFEVEDLRCNLPAAGWRASASLKPCSWVKLVSGKVWLSEGAAESDR